VSFIPLSMRLIHWWCAFLSLVSMIAGGGVKRQKDAPDHITTGKAYIDDDESVGKISTYNDRFANTLSRMDTIPDPEMRGLNVPMLRANPITQEHVEEKHNYVPGATVETRVADLQAKVSNAYRPARGPGSTNVRVSMDATKPKKTIDDLYILMNQLVNLERILMTQAFIKQPEQLFYPPYSALSLLHAHYPYTKPLPAQRSQIPKQETINNTENNTEELAEYEQRGEHVTAACKEYHSELAARYKAVWPKESYITVVDKADVFIKKENAGFLWCRVPKAASSSFTSVLINEWFPWEKHLTMGDQQNVLRRAWSPHKQRRPRNYISQAARTEFSFMTSRHPLERILSAYRDKFFLNGDFDFERKKVTEFRRLYGNKIIAKYRKSTPSDPKYEKAPTFREFVEYLVDLPISKFNDHWIPMYLQCMPCHIKYTIISRLDTISRDSDLIFKTLELSARLPKSHVTQGITTDNTVSSYYSTISKDLLEKLYNIYKFDFLLFNYTMNGYASYVENR